MATSPFEPKAALPQWKVLYDHFAALNPGDDVTWDELEHLLPDTPRASIRTAVYAATRHLEEDKLRTMDSVRGVGYRMVEAVDHEAIARRFHKGSKRKMSKAARKIHYADRSRLNRDQRQRMDALETHIRAQQGMIRRLESKQANMQVEQVRQKGDVAELSEKVDKLAQLLNRHGIGA